MKILMINAIYGTRSSGRSMLELTNKLRSEGHDVYIVSPQKNYNDDNFYRIGTDFDHKLHGFLSRISGKQAYFSKRATKKLVKFIDKIKPDVIHVQVLHGNYINFNLFFREIEKRKIPLVYVLDDCWPFTGKCSHFTAAKCYKWQTGCGKCPQKNSCNPTWFFDKTKTMWRDKKRAYDQRCDDFAGNGIAEGSRVDHAAQDQANAGADPKHQLHHSGIIIFVFRIGRAGKGANPLHDQHEGRYTENGNGFTAPVVRFAVDAPVNGDGIGKLIPQNQTHKDRDQQHKGCENQGLLILFKHGHYLLSSP